MVTAMPDWVGGRRCSEDVTALVTLRSKDPDHDRGNDPCSVLALYAVISSAWLSRFAALEQREGMLDVERARLAVAGSLEECERLTRDWSAWDEPTSSSRTTTRRSSSPASQTQPSPT